MWFGEPWSLGGLFLVLAIAALLGGGLLLFFISDRSMYFVMWRLEHPDEPLPSWRRYRRGLNELFERLRSHYRYFLRYGLDASVLGFLVGFACMVAGAVIADNIDEIAGLLGWN
jgi:hypothetical protein